MSYVTKMKQNQNKIFALVLSIILCIITGFLFDCYYDLNDDVLMKDIVAGVYSGTPSGYNIQMLFPLSFLISLFYRACAAIPWYGLFLCGCHVLCFYLITERMLGFINKVWSKIIAVLVEASLLFSLLLYEIVFVQYTVTAAILAGTAAFLFFTSQIKEEPKSFLKENFVSVLLVIIAFQVRTEMLLLVLPMICVTGVCKWAAEKPIYTKKNVQKYFSVFGAILVGLIVSQGIHMLAYNANGWKQFNDFFDYRTQIYDFYGIPPYEGNEAFYESIGLSQEEQILLHNYNFGMDEEIDEKLLEKICEYANNQRKMSASFTETLKKAAKTYKYRLFHETDFPFNQVVIILYLMVFVTALLNKHFNILWELPLLAAVRTTLWMYIEYGHRTPPRITHSLYMMEILILIAMLLWEKKSNTKVKLIVGIICVCILAFMGISYLPKSYKAVCTQYDIRENVNREYTAFQEYTQAHKGNFYFWDVYSSVDYSEKLFLNVSHEMSNYDIMGGWLCKSPLMRQKYATFSITSMDEALLSKHNVFIVVKSDASIELASWIPAYYENKGFEVELEKEDSIYLGEKDVFTVYSIKPILSTKEE